MTEVCRFKDLLLLIYYQLLELFILFIRLDRFIRCSHYRLQSLKILSKIHFFGTEFVYHDGKIYFNNFLGLLLCSGEAKQRVLFSPLPFCVYMDKITPKLFTDLYQILQRGQYE